MSISTHGKAVRIVHGAKVYGSVTAAMEGTGLSRYILNQLIAKAASGEKVFILGQQIYALAVRLHHTEGATRITAGVVYKGRTDHPLLTHGYCTRRMGAWKG